MHEENTHLAANCGETCHPPGHGQSQCPNPSRSVVASGTQHGSGLADSAQPSTGERSRDGRAPNNMEGFLSSSSDGGCHEGQPCAEKRMASLGHEAYQRRQPVYPQSQEDVVKPHGPVSTDNVLRVLENQRYRCALTGCSLTPETAALDHIQPIRCGGEHVIENTQVLHKNLNRAKGSLTNEEFIQMCHEVAAHRAN